MEWDTFYYWHRRAFEIKSGKTLPETNPADEAKVDDDTFKKQLEYMEKKLAEHEKSSEGTIDGG
jgi:hypothetical protein